MKRAVYFIMFTAIYPFASFGFEMVPMMQYEFDKPNLTDNDWAEIPGGFIPNTPKGTVTTCNFAENEISSSKDKKGLAITVQPREVVFIYGKTPVNTEGIPVLLRMTVRSSSLNVSIALVALRGNLESGNNVDGSIATHIPAGAESFVQSEKRMILVYQTDKGNEITPSIQVVATGQWGSATVWIDKLEILKLDSQVFGSGVDIDSSIPTPTPVLPTQTPTPTATPKHLPPGAENIGLKEITINIPNLPSGAKQLEMVLIPAGTFLMGSPDNEKDRYSNEGPQHWVTISKPFYMGKYEVTQAQWQAVMNYNPSTLSEKVDNPVEEINWYHCAKFCNALSRKEGRTPVYDETSWLMDWKANGYRLPTEAEWEYACRSGTTTRYYWGDDPYYMYISGYEWYGGNDDPLGPKEVGLKYPNAFGLYDMLGNESEWCNDLYGSYSSSNQVDPIGGYTSPSVVRGGVWSSAAVFCRAAHRSWHEPDSSSIYIGFRVYRTYP